MTPSDEKLIGEVDIDSITFFPGLSPERAADGDEDTNKAESKVSEKPKQLKRHILSFWKTTDKDQQKQKD